MMVCKMSQSIINPYILPTKLASEESKSPPMGLIGWAAAEGAIVGVIAGAIAGTIVNPVMGTIPGVNGVLAAAMGVPPVLWGVMAGIRRSPNTSNTGVGTKKSGLI